MSRKGVRNREQDGGAHGRAHAESGRPQSGLTSSISLAAGAGSTVVDGWHGSVSTSRCRPAADRAAAADFQDGETTQQHTRRRRRSRHNNVVETGENNTELTDSSSSSPYHIQQCPVTVESSSCSTGRIVNVLNSSSRNSISNTTITGNKQQAKIKGDFLPNIVTTAICNNKKKTVFLQETPSNCDSLSFKTIATLDSSSHNNNTTMAIRDLQYLSNSSDYDYDEDVEDETENMENGSEWFKSRCRNFDSVVGFELVDPNQVTTHGVVVDSLDMCTTGKANKDITVDDLFAEEHLAVSPGPAVVIPQIGRAHV